MKPGIKIILSLSGLIGFAVLISAAFDAETVQELNLANGATRERVMVFGLPVSTTPKQPPRWDTTDSDGWTYMCSTSTVGYRYAADGRYGNLGATFQSLDYFVEEISIPRADAREIYQRVRDRFVEFEGRSIVDLEVDDWDDFRILTMNWYDEHDQEQTEVVYERPPKDG